MDPNTRVDLFITCHDSDMLSAGFTTRALASKTEEAVLLRAENNGTKPFIFVGSMSVRSEIADAMLQTRPGGLVLFLVSPEFFNNWLCVAELQAFLKMCSDSNVHLKLRYVGLESSADAILSSPSTKRQVPTLSQFGRWADIPVTTIQETAENLCDVVFGAWECTDNAISPHDLPTVLGHTRYESYLALQRVFTEDDLPAFRASLSLPRTAANVLDAFGIAGEHRIVTQYNVKKLYAVITYRSTPASAAQRCMVEAYERKWVHSSRLEWEDKFRHNLLRLFKNNENGAPQASSSNRHQKNSCITNAVVQEISAYDLKRPPGTVDLFEPYFDEPPQSAHVVLDFDNPVTAEGQLLRKVLEMSKGDSGRGVSASGNARGAAHGMGGVGKTTALRALCHEDEVKRAYSDGIWFLEFGEDADDRKVIEEVAQCVDNSGGGVRAQEMNETRSLSDVLKKGAQWLRGKTVLLVCDDIWENDNPYGYLPDVTKLLQHAPKSRLVISTRNRNIAKSAGVSVEFAPLVANDSKARNMLLACIEDRVEISDEVAEDGIQRILDICAGLPLALAIAGRGLEEYVIDSNTASNGIRLYCEYLEQDSVCVTVEELEHYPGLNRVINSSLSHCQKWGASDEVQQMYGEKLDMMSLFKGLCILEKQMAVPKRVLRHVWGLNDKCTDEVMKKFADSNLASRVETDLSTQREFGLRLHDLVLVLCQQMAQHECTKWHKSIVDAYGEKLSADRKFEDGEQGETSRSWWDAFDDGYIFAHLSRHLALSDQSHELKYLLCDIRWAMRRLKSGELASLDVDFKYLFRYGEHVGSGMSRVHEALTDSWLYARKKQDLLAFYVFAHFTPEERKERDVCRLLSSVDRDFPKPWLRPKTRSTANRDRRQVWKEGFSDEVRLLTADWTSGNVFAVDSKSIFAWSTKERRILWKKPCTDEVEALNNDGNVIVSVDILNIVRHWNAQNGALVAEALIGRKPFFRRLFCCYRDFVRDYPMYRAAVSNDGKVIVTLNSDRKIRRLDAQSGAPIGNALNSAYVTCVAMSNDGSVIVSGSIKGAIRRWDAQKGVPISDPFIVRENYAHRIAVNDDASIIVSGSGDTIQRWDAQSGEPIGDPLIGHEGNVNCIAVNDDGSIIVSSSADQTMRLWDCETEAPTANPLCNDSIVSGSNDKSIRNRRAQSETPIGDRLTAPNEPVRCITISNDGSVIVSGSDDRTILRRDAQSGALIGDPLIGHESPVRCVAISNDGKLIVSGSDDRTIRRWDAHSGAPIGDPLIGHKSPVRCVAISNDGSVVVSGSDDRTIRRWDGQSGAPICNPLTGHESPVTCVAISNDASVIVSGSDDGTIRRWDAQNDAPIGDPLMHSSFPTYAAVSNDGNVIVSCFYDGTIRRWGFRTLRSEDAPASDQKRNLAFELTKLNAPIDKRCLAIDLEKKIFIFSHSNGDIVICNLIE